MSQLKEGLHNILVWLQNQQQKYPHLTQYWWLRYPTENYAKPYIKPKLSKQEIESLVSKLEIEFTSELINLYQLFDGTQFGYSIWESDWLFDVNLTSQAIKGVGLLSLNSLIKEYLEQYNFYLSDNYQQLDHIPYPLSHLSGLNTFVGQNCIDGCLIVENKNILPHIRIREYKAGTNNTLVMYSSLTNMIKTVTESYQEAYDFDNQGNLSKNLAKIKHIWQKYNSSYFVLRTRERFNIVKNKLATLEQDISSAWLQELGDILILTENSTLLQLLITVLTQPPNNNQLDINLDFLRFQASKIITQAQYKKAIPLLIEQLNNYHWIARYWAVQTLGKMNDDAATKPLVNLLQDEQELVRLASQKALQQLKTTTKNNYITMENNQNKAYRDSLIAETNQLMKTLNFTVEQGRAYLSQHYQKISRLQLTDKELTEFRDYLQNKNNKTKPNNASENKSNIEVVEITFHELLQQIDRLMKQVNWTKKDGEAYLLTNYKKRSRLLLSDEEILEFRDMLQQKVNNIS